MQTIMSCAHNPGLLIRTFKVLRMQIKTLWEGKASLADVPMNEPTGPPGFFTMFDTEIWEINFFLQWRRHATGLLTQQLIQVLTDFGQGSQQ